MTELYGVKTVSYKGVNIVVNTTVFSRCKNLHFSNNLKRVSKVLNMVIAQKGQATLDTDV